jgi:oligopeptide/dipeptide ABC transporter ATP-binding protein
MSSLLRIDRLRVEITAAEQRRAIVSNAVLEIAPGEAVGLVGESGSGKSTIARAVMRVLPENASVSGQIMFDGESVMDMTRRRLLSFRQREVSIVFQDPTVHLNPVRTVGDFLTEGLRLRGLSRASARTRAEELLANVRIANPARVFDSYPHQLSGGMLQRAMIAAAVASEPRLLLADEPTTALDVTTQAEVVAILDALRQNSGLALLFITHDLELAAAICDRTVVLYAGRTIEEQAAWSVHHEPLHPYTAGLLKSRPHVSSAKARLDVLPGRPLAAYEAPAGCAFAPRCRYAEPECTATEQELRQLGGGRVACRRAEELRNALAEKATAADG